MIFRRRPKAFGSKSPQGAGVRPLLHVLPPNQRPKDFKDPIEHSFRDADVVISRAELDLRRALQALMIHTGSMVNSLEVLVALQLPGNTAALFWAARLLLNEALVGDLYADNAVRRTNHDARLLYQGISKIDLDPWYQTVVGTASIAALPAGLQFLPGHPVPQRYYRQHPLPGRSQVYLPVATYFADLFYERRQELVRLLVNLGAIRIQFENLAEANPGPPEVLTYPARLWPPFNPADYPWLPYEPQWQRLMGDRLSYQTPTQTFDLTIDINGLIAAQVAALKNLMAQLDSVKVVHNDVVDRDYLQPQRVTVVFAESG
ncbi:MAG: hypothetical protein ACFCVB_12030 [Nodosilinea sp.]